MPSSASSVRSVPACSPRPAATGPTPRRRRTRLRPRRGGGHPRRPRAGVPGRPLDLPAAAPADRRCQPAGRRAAPPAGRAAPLAREPPSRCELEPIPVHSRDEIGQLAGAFNDIQRVTAEVADEQAVLLRKGISDIFVNLARRNQALLDRQIEFIDQLEANEADPDQLENLFRLDHLATRMRRNAESLLVLAGADPPRRRGRPVAAGRRGAGRHRRGGGLRPDQPAGARRRHASRPTWRSTSPTCWPS